MFKEILRIARIILGMILVLIGIVGVFMPILPGWIFIFIGIELVGIHLIFLDRIKRYVRSIYDVMLKKQKKS